MRLLLHCLGCLLAFSALANDISQQRFEYLVQQKNNLLQSIDTEKRATHHSTSSVELKQLYLDNEEKLTTIHTKIQSLQFQIDNQKSQLLALADRLKAFQKSSTHFVSNIHIEQKLLEIQSEYVMGKKNVDLLEGNLSLAYEYEAVVLKTHQQLYLAIALSQRDKELARLQEEHAALNGVLKQLYMRGIELERGEQQQQPTSGALSAETSANIVLNDQAIDLTQLKLAKLDLNKKWVEAAYLLKKEPSMATLEGVSEIYKKGTIALSKQEGVLKKQQARLLAERTQMTTPALDKTYHEILSEIKAQIQDTAIQQQILQEDLENDEVILSKQLSLRSRFPDLRPASWPTIFWSICQIPHLFYQYVKNLTYKVYENMVWQDWQTHLFLVGMIFSVGLCGAIARIFLTMQLKGITPTRLTARVYHGVLLLAYQNVPYFLCLLIFWIIFYQNGMAYSAYQLLFNLIWVFIFFRNLQLISQLVFLDKVSEHFGHDVKIYQRTRWLLIAGGLSTALMVLSHQFPLSDFMQALFNRLFMLFLWVVSIAIWRSKEVITHLLLPILKNQKRYVIKMALILLTLLPATLLTTAVIGLCGYNNLAWSLSQYQAQLLILVALYVLVRGLLIDALEMLSEWMIVSLYNGWLWIEVFLKPLDKVLRLILFLSMLWFFCYIIEEATAVSVMKTLSHFLHYELFNSPGVDITPESVLAFLVLGAFFTWLAKWTREFCYRWVYHHASDVGIRNSLSVFTQYAVIVVGGFITLRVLGFDFTGLSYVLGGLAVGMGFGLRDFANNIVGGLILLIERPVREGDLITLGEHEGRVAHIGIRSMRVCSWDNMEVLIPNSETFSKPFINWTHQDSIVRTVIPFKVNRDDSPELVQQIILDILAITPEVLPHPEPQAFLTQIDEALMGFEARYFINVNVHTRFAVRSKILFAILDKFKEKGIRAPIPPMQVEITEKP
ncbi:MAG: mechanosensitive ion channel [Gammaproteobacteria bacterium]|nr:mechanosensitive ion channel [Gammaproteobacteria bacterium]